MDYHSKKLVSQPNENNKLYCNSCIGDSLNFELKIIM